LKQESRDFDPQLIENLVEVLRTATVDAKIK
jgi:hypothetical protein